MAFLRQQRAPSADELTIIHVKEHRNIQQTKLATTPRSRMPISNDGANAQWLQTSDTHISTPHHDAAHTEGAAPQDCQKLICFGDHQHSNTRPRRDLSQSPSNLLKPYRLENSKIFSHRQRLSRCSRCRCCGRRRGTRRRRDRRVGR